MLQPLGRNVDPISELMSMHCHGTTERLERNLAFAPQSMEAPA
jgi:hypothetical protein